MDERACHCLLITARSLPAVPTCCAPAHHPPPLCCAAASYEPLDVVLRHDRRRIPLLLDFVRYPHNPAGQAEAVRIATHLSGGLCLGWDG